MHISVGARAGENQCVALVFCNCNKVLEIFRFEIITKGTDL